MEPKIKKPKIKAPNAKSIAGSFKKKFGLLFLYVILFGILALLISFFIAKNAPSKASFMSFQIYMLVLGVFHCFLIFHWLKIRNYRALKAILLTVVTLLFIGILSIFNIKIPVFPEFPSYYTWGIIAFLIPWITMISFEFLATVPVKVYRKWFYPYGKEVPVIEVIAPKKIKFYISLQHSDEEYNEFSLNVPMKYKVGEFLHYFIHRYNYDKNPESPIFVSPDNTNENLYGWIFTTKGSMNNMFVLDPDKSFTEQGIKENSTILVDRYFTTSEKIIDSQEVDIEEIKN